MAKIQYRRIEFKPERLRRIVQIDGILQEYIGEKVSVRQVFYRLVAASLIPNSQAEYDKVADLVTDARYAGLIDWDAIEDRNREPVKAEEWDSGRSALDDTLKKFRVDRWAGQPYYVELHVEKAALSGVLWPVALDYHVVLFPTRGYGSATSTKETADRFRWHCRDGRRGVILHVGDHDPSGMHMETNARERLVEMGCPRDIDVRRVALTMEQIEKYRPPPNPLKRKLDPEKYKVADGSFADSRAAAYVDEFGMSSWEVDALPPKDLALITRTALNAYVDKKLMEKAMAREKLIKKKIKAFAAGFEEPKVA